MAFVKIREESVLYSDENGSHTLLVEILQKGGTAGTDDIGIDLTNNDINIKGGTENATGEEFILPKRVEFEIRDINNLGELLINGEEKDFRLKLTEDGTEIFDGYLVTGATEINLFEPAPKILLTAFDGFTILKDIAFEKTDYYNDDVVLVKTFLEDISAKIGIDKEWIMYTNYTNVDGSASRFPIGHSFKPQHLIRDMDEPTYMNVLERFCTLFNFQAFQHEGNYILIDLTERNVSLDKINISTGTVVSSVTLYGGLFQSINILKYNPKPKAIFVEPAKEIQTNINTDTEEFLKNPEMSYVFSNLQWWTEANTTRYDGTTLLTGDQQTESGVEMLFDGSSRVTQRFRKPVSNDRSEEKTILDISFDIQIITDQGNLLNAGDELYYEVFELTGTGNRVLEGARADGGSSAYGSIRPDKEGYQFGIWKDSGSTISRKFVIGIPNPDGGTKLPLLIKARRTIRIVADGEVFGSDNIKFLRLLFAPKAKSTDPNYPQTTYRTNDFILSKLTVDIVNNKPYGYEKRLYSNNNVEGGRTIKRQWNIGSRSPSTFDFSFRYPVGVVDDPIVIENTNVSPAEFPDSAIKKFRTLFGKKITLSKFRVRHSSISLNLLNYYAINAGVGSVIYVGVVSYFDRKITRGFTDIELFSTTLGQDNYFVRSVLGRKTPLKSDLSSFEGLYGFNVYAGISFNISAFS